MLRCAERRDVEGAEPRDARARLRQCAAGGEEGKCAKCVAPRHSEVDIHRITCLLRFSLAIWTGRGKADRLPSIPSRAMTDTAGGFRAKSVELAFICGLTTPNQRRRQAFAPPHRPKIEVLLTVYRA
jgi:hypothetical protein